MGRRLAASALFARFLAATLGLLLLSISAVGWASVKKAPYLIYPGDETAMQVQWQLTDAAPATIEWGLDNSYGLGSVETAEYSSDHQHSYTLSGLTPGATYYYHVLAEGEDHPGFFRAGAVDWATSLKFIAYGDTRTNAQVHDQVAEAVVATYTADPDWQTFILHVGDLVSDGNSESVWQNEFFSPGLTHIRDMTAQLPLQACMGNHEGSGVLFQKYFPYPFVNTRYWSFDDGPVHVVVVDQYTSYTPGSDQLAWIESDLAASSKRWKFMLLHEPGWSAGGGHSNEVPVQLYLQPLCIQYGVSIVFGGHNHYYARAVVDGVQHVTTGGGAPLYTPNLSYPYIVAGAAAYHYCKVQVTPEELDFVVLTPAGVILDAFTLEASTPVEEGLPLAGTRLQGVFPNPCHPQTEVSFTVGREQAIRLSVFDPTGRRVDVLTDRLYPAGAHVVRWDGRDAAGQPLPSGTYLLRLDALDASQAEKLILVR